MKRTCSLYKFMSTYRNILKGNEPVYQIVWAEPEDFKEVLISPVMLQDHMPDQVLSALKKVKQAFNNNNNNLNTIGTQAETPNKRYI